MSLRDAGKRLRRAVRFGLLRAAVASLAWLPVGVACALGAAIGRLAYIVASGERRAALEGLAVAFPDKPDAERRRIARAAFANLGRSAMELVVARRLDRDLFERVVIPEPSRALLREALAEGRGVVFVTAHLGNWELMARRVAREFDARTVAREAHDPRVTALLERKRAEGGLKTIWRGKPGAAREILRALKEGAILGLLLDQDIPSVQGVFVPFFGHPAWTPRAAADLAQRREPRPVVLGTARRLGPGRHEIRVRRLEPGSDPVEATARFTAAIEAEIRERPEEWVWMHRRWKTKSR